MSGVPDFSDDFSNTQLTRYYELVPGVGEIARTPRGLGYRITRAGEGPASAEDDLSIDTLGRPQPPTAQVVFRFSGDEWVLEMAVEYEFGSKANGRHAYLWLVPGEPSERCRESVAIVRSADLPAESHRLAIHVTRTDGASRTVVLTTSPETRHWFRVTRSRGRLLVGWSTDAATFSPGIDEVWPTRAGQCLLINSSSFAGGAAFTVRGLRLFGAQPEPAPHSHDVFLGQESSGSVVAADQVLAALEAGHGVLLRNAVVRDPLDFTRIKGPITGDVRMLGCTFDDSVLGSDRVRTQGHWSWEACTLHQVSLSSMEFGGPTRFVNCQFLGDTRFIETRFRRGANFSGCTFGSRPFFRSMHVTGALSLYHTTFAHGPDLSSVHVEGDVSLSDVAVHTGDVTLERSHLRGAVRLMTTLQREPQPLGNTVNLSHTISGTLIVSAGDQGNQVEHTGPARWEFPASLSLHAAVVGRFEAYRVHFVKTVDVSASRLRETSFTQSDFAHLIGEWPIDGEFYSCFISYSSRDEAFAVSLRTSLESQGVKCWFAPAHMRIGDSISQRIRDEIYRHDRLLLILSRDAADSNWVRQEVDVALERERLQQRHVLLPIELDEASASTTREWVASIRQTRHIAAFRARPGEEAYQLAVARLLRELKPAPSVQ